MAKKFNKQVFNISILIFTLVLFVILVFFAEGTEHLWDMIRTMKVLWLLVAFSCMVMYWLMEASVLHTLTKVIHGKQKFINSVRTSMVGQFFNSVTPLATGGQPSQAYVMAKDGINAGFSVSILIVKTLLFEIVLFIYALLILIFKYSFFVNTIPHFLFLFALGSVANILMLAFCCIFFINQSFAFKIANGVFWVLGKFIKKEKIDKAKTKFDYEVHLFNKGSKMIFNSPIMAIKAFIFQSLNLFFLFVIPFFIFLAIEPGPGDFISMFSAQGIVSMISFMIPLPGASFGAEGLGYLFFNLFFKTAPVLGVILIWRIITFYSNILFGGLACLLSPAKPFKRKASSNEPSEQIE